MLLALQMAYTYDGCQRLATAVFQCASSNLETSVTRSQQQRWSFDLLVLVQVPSCNQANKFMQPHAQLMTVTRLMQ